MKALSGSFKFGVALAVAFTLVHVVLPDRYDTGVFFLLVAMSTLWFGGVAAIRGHMYWMVAGSALGAAAFGAMGWLLVGPPGRSEGEVLALGLPFVALGVALTFLEARFHPESWRKLGEAAERASLLDMVLGRHIPRG